MARQGTEFDGSAYYFAKYVEQGEHHRAAVLLRTFKNNAISGAIVALAAIDSLSEGELLRFVDYVQRETFPTV